RTSLKVRTPVGETTEERRGYDRYGRLAEIASFGVSVRYRYDAGGRVARQTVDGTPIDFAYTKYGQLAGKYLGGKERPDAAVEYEYAKSGRLVARTANGVRQTYEYDGRGQLLAVKENGADVERYAYDRAGNMVKKTVRGRTTTFAFDGANQLVSSTTDGVTTRYAYDAAGRLVREGNRTCRYGYLDKVLAVTEGKRTYKYDYHADGQLARADYGDGRAEEFGWDGLALVRRGDERFVNEPHIGGGNPVASSKGTTYFNDVLGTTVGVKKGRKYTAAALTAFGEPAPCTGSPAPGAKHPASGTFFTGKPHVEGLGRVFLLRNYRADLARWQTADPLGYPDGWNRLAYCGNEVGKCVDVMGALSFGVYDSHNRNSRVLGVFDIQIARGGSKPGHCDTQIEAELHLLTRTISVKFLVGITISMSAVTSSSVAAGTEVAYVEHRKTDSDATIEGAWVYEGILAHERGHAQHAIGTMAAALEFAYSNLEAAWQAGLYTYEEVRQKILEIQRDCEFDYMTESGAFANAATSNWFNNSPEWRNISFDGRTWVWKKEE
ncbi:MAG: hypothetical protein ACI4RD_04610, partial [Kiritimatiellia bacterium]